MITLALGLALLVVGALRLACAGEAGAAGPFKELEAAFPGQLSVSKGTRAPAEFCPDNTCYAFERAPGISDEEYAGFIYLYLYYSSDYAATVAWQNKPESGLTAKAITSRTVHKPCRALAGTRAGLCVLNALLSKLAVKVYDVRYDEGERSAAPVLAAALGRAGEVRYCREFTEAFLGWYVPLALADHDEPGAIIALRQRPGLFGEKLREALLEDRRVQELSTDGITGIDFDPFLSSQDPAEKYSVGKTMVEDGKCLAAIGRPGADTWDVRAELKRRGGDWRFINFHYSTDIPGHANLLSLLLGLKRGRAALPPEQRGE